MESNSLILNYSRINLLHLIEECVDVLNFKAEEKGIELIIQRGGGDRENMWPSNIKIDGNRLKQIIINLVSNGLKYTQKGYVKLYN